MPWDQAHKELEAEIESLHTERDKEIRHSGEKWKRFNAEIKALRAERDELKARLDMLEGLRGDHYSDPRYFVDEELGAVCIESGGGDCFETLDECQIVNHLNEIVGDEKKEHARAEASEARVSELEGVVEKADKLSETCAVLTFKDGSNSFVYSARRLDEYRKARAAMKVGE